MGFSVDVAALAGLPRHMGRLGEDAAAARAYVDRYTQLSSGEGIINQLLGGHREATRKVRVFFQMLDAAAERQGNAVSAALNHYRQTDLAAAAALDAKLTVITQTPHTQPDMGSLGFADRGEPQNGLTAPPDYSGQYRFEMKWYSYLSPSSHIRSAILEFTEMATAIGLLDRPIDVFNEWLKPWLGDWAGFRACADVYENLASSALTMSANVRSGSIDSQFVWTGNAADSCRLDLNDTCDALNLANTRLHELSAEYRSVAESTYKLVEAVVGLLMVAADIVAMGLADMVAASRGGPGVALSAHFVQSFHNILRLVDVAMKVFDCIKIAEAGAKAFASGVEGLNVIDPKGPMPSLAGGMPAAYSPPVRGGGKVPSFT
jgi:hypothetical protein